MAQDQVYEYCIVGGGIAGCVLATRLSQKGFKVALIEAGPSAQILFGPLDWKFETTPQRNLDGRKLVCNAGRLLGGGSVFNLNVYTRCHPADYEKWAKMADDESWSWQAIQELFKKTEHFHPGKASPIDLSLHGQDGPIHTTVNVDQDGPYSITPGVLKALEEAGYKGSDLNSGITNGWAYLQTTGYKGEKQVVNLQYMQQAPETLTIIDNAPVDKVLFEGKKAVGIQTADGREILAKNVIISAGVLNTPGILLRSGVGPKTELDKHGISQVVDLPVGKNLWDHLNISLAWEAPGHPEEGVDFLRDQAKVQAAVEQYYSQGRTGPLAKSVIDLLAFSKLDTTEPQIEYLLVSGPCRMDPAVTLPTSGAHVGASTLLLHPKSRGTVTLSSTDALAPPIVDPNHFADPSDEKTLAAGVKEMYRIAKQQSFPGTNEFHHFNGVGKTNTKQHLSDDDIVPVLKQGAMTTWHFGGTCKMSADDTGVVDSKGRVKGVDNLMVVDASIIPTTMSGHLQAVVYMLAEKIAGELINKA